MTTILLNLVLTAGFALAATPKPPLLVMLDPGHGGRDQGTTRGPALEAEITLAVSQQLHELLRRDRRFQVLTTRTSDQTVSLSERARLSKNKRAKIFLSIHVNSSPDRRARGAEFYFQNQLPPDEESMFLAHQENVAEAGENTAPQTYEFLDAKTYPLEVGSILNDLLDGDRIQRSSDLSKALKLNWRGSRKSKSNSIRQAPFYVLSQMRTPSTLVELGFLTNDEDLKELTNPATQKKMAEDLYRGLVQYKDSLDKVSISP
jgi:N-acetylmuramoyl-L-alanine amidase